MSNVLKVYIPGKNAKEHVMDFNSVIPGIKGSHQVMYQIGPGEDSTITNNTDQIINVSLNSEKNYSNLEMEYVHKSVGGLSILSISLFVLVCISAYFNYKRSQNER